MITAETITARRETDVYVLMVRYGTDFWTATMTYRSVDEAEQAARSPVVDGVTGYRIVKVSGLPVVVQTNEV